MQHLLVSTRFLFFPESLKSHLKQVDVRVFVEEGVENLFVESAVFSLSVF